MVISVSANFKFAVRGLFLAFFCALLKQPQKTKKGRLLLNFAV
jgi:hypothetical protein